ncbi:MAG TPA: DNA glycosylase [bacterium]|nr:DNA glycosylase [bacterium]
MASDRHVLSRSYFGDYPDLLPAVEIVFEGHLTVPEPFSLELTLLCGQCFRWEQDSERPGWFRGVAGQAYWELSQKGNWLRWKCTSTDVRGEEASVWLGRYLGFEDPLDSWSREFETSEVLGKPLSVLKGMRLIRQEPWECTVSYMFAQGLSVKVIRHAIGKFCAKFGKPIDGAPGCFTFPEPSTISLLSPDQLRAFTNNYRARADRIIRAARVVEAQVLTLEHFKNIPCDDAREALMALDGIGPKIADCILLFSMDHYSAFPVDRWVLRAMKQYYRSVKLLGAGSEAPTRTQYVKIVQKARKFLGSRCGVASEYLFLFLRLLDDAKLREELRPYCGEWETVLAMIDAPKSKKKSKS